MRQTPTKWVTRGKACVKHTVEELHANEGGKSRGESEKGFKCY